MAFGVQPRVHGPLLCVLARLLFLTLESRCVRVTGRSCEKHYGDERGIRREAKERQSLPRPYNQPRPWLASLPSLSLPLNP